MHSKAADVMPLVPGRLAASFPSRRSTLEPQKAAHSFPFRVPIGPSHLFSCVRVVPLESQRGNLFDSRRATNVPNSALQGRCFTTRRNTAHGSAACHQSLINTLPCMLHSDARWCTYCFCAYGGEKPRRVSIYHTIAPHVALASKEQLGNTAPPRQATQPTISKHRHTIHQYR